MPEITKHQRYVMQTWLRSQIKEHPKNPRRITDAAKKKLRDKMKEVGLLQPPIVNSRTGYLLGGHQRLAVMDSLERYKPGKSDYRLDVAVVDLPEEEELAMLVFLNNASAQGQWDADMLAELGGEVSFEDMGFDRVDIEVLLEGGLDSPLADDITAQEVKGSLAEINAARKHQKDSMRDDLSSDYWVVVVCRDYKQKVELLRKLNLPTGEQYIKPDPIFGLIDRL